LGFIGFLMLLAVAPPYAGRAAVTLVDMNATAQANSTILVAWETATELNTAAFSLYRAEAANGPWDTVVNTQPAQGNGAAGATYGFVDTDVEVGTRYYYLLEEIESDGTRTKLEDFIVSAMVLAPEATRTTTPGPTPTPTRTPTPTPSADRTIYLPLLLRTN
jgi:hypothetical protein